MTEPSAGLNLRPSDKQPFARLVAPESFLARNRPFWNHAMQLSDFLDFDAVRIDLPAGNKRQLLNQLAQIAGARLSLDPSAIADSVAERERLGSTGFGGGVAIPHGKLDGLDRVYALVTRLAAPIDYKAIDGAPVDLDRKSTRLNSSH